MAILNCTKTVLIQNELDLNKLNWAFDIDKNTIIFEFFFFKIFFQKFHFWNFLSCDPGKKKRMTIIAYSYRFGIRCQYHCLTRTGSTENISTISAMMLKYQIKVRTLAKLQKFHLCSSGTQKPFFEPIGQDGWVHEFHNCSKESFRIVKWGESSRILPHSEFEWNAYREDALHFTTS